MRMKPDEFIALLWEYKNKGIATKAKAKVQKAGAVRARIPPRAGMKFRGYRKRDPQWTDAV